MTSRIYVLYAISSVITVLLLMFHLTDDVVHGFEDGKLQLLTPVPIVVLWLYGTLVLSERRAGYVITLVGALLSLGVPVIHLMGKGVGGIAKSGDGFFFVWTLLATAVTGLFAVVLSVLGLWRPLQRER